MPKISTIVADENFHWAKIPPDPQKGTQGNYMPLEQALSRHTGLPPAHLYHQYPQLMDYVNVQGAAFNHPGMSGPQLNEHTARSRAAMRVCDACDFYYAQLNWPKEQVAMLLRNAGL